MPVEMILRPPRRSAVSLIEFSAYHHSMFSQILFPGRKPAAKAVEVRPESDDDDDEGVPPSKYIKSKRVASQGM